MMKYATGGVGVVAAALFVAYSAVITYNVAYTMTTEFQQLAGLAAAGIVLWECLGLLYVRQCWNNGSRWLAAGGLALVLAAGVYTVRLDLRFHVTGQADMTASRDASVETHKMTREELSKARGRRDDLQKIKKLSEAQEDELHGLTKRISALEGKFDTQIVNAGGMPEAGWASRMLGKINDDEVWWQDALMVFGLLFWALARMLAMPLAIASMGSLRTPQEALGAAKSDPVVLAGTRLDPQPVALSVAPRTPMKALERISGVKAEPVSDPYTLPERVKETEKNEHGTTEPDGGGTPIAEPTPVEAEPEIIEERKGPSLVWENDAPPVAPRANKQAQKPEAKASTWLSDCCSQTDSPSDTVTSGECWRSYLSYCQSTGKHPLHRKVFSRQLGVLLGRKTGKSRKRDKNGSVFTGLMINPIVAQATRRRVA